MTPGRRKSLNYRRAALEAVDWWPCETVEEVFAEFRNMVVTMYASGHSTCSMARLLHISWSMAKTELVAAGVQLKHGGSRPTYHVVYRNRIVPLASACSVTGISYQSVMYRVKTDSIRPWQAFERALREAA